LEELIKAFFQVGEQSWHELRADCLDQAQEAALDILVIISEQFVDVLVEVLVNCNYHPLRVHFEEEEESQDGLASKYN